MLANWSGDIPDGTVWDNSQVQTITGNVHIPAGAALTIQPGTVVQFDAGTNMSVDGTLDAPGTAAAPVTFTSYQDSSALGGANNANPGDWGAIAFNAGSQASTLDHVVVKYGGGGNAGEVIVGDSIALSNSIFSNSNAAGMRITGSSPTLANDTWENNLAHFGSAGAAISMDLASSPVIRGPTLQGNGINAAVLDSGSITGSAKWNNPALSYDLSGSVTVAAGASLEIDAGQTVQLGMPFNSGVDVIVNGTLHSMGTAAAGVTITSYRDDSTLGGANNAAPGDWGSVSFNTGSDASTLDHTVIRYGGGNGEASETIIAANVAASNSTMSNSYSSGLRITTSNPTLTADTFQNNGGAAVSADLVSQPIITGETPTSISGNGSNGMALDSGSFTANATWNAADVVYVPTGNLTVPSGITLSIAPGVIIKPNNIYNFEFEGTLKAQGTAAAPIIITAFADDSAGGNSESGPHIGPGPGEGLTLWFESGSTGNVMDHVDVRYGQDVVGGNRPGAIDVDGSLTLSNSIVRDCGRDGVFVSPNATATITSSILVDNSSGVEAQAGATFTLINNTIDGNTFDGVVLDSPNATLTNNLITNNGDAGINQTGPTTPTMSFNDVFNPHAINGNYNQLTDQTGTNGNISVDPKYVNAAGLQYNLQPGSPVEDAGTSTGAPPTDFFGNPRYKDPNIIGRGDGSGYDVGAIEVQNAATSNIDLTVANVTAPATGVEGQSITVTWTDESAGAGAADGPWHDAVYLSATPVFTPDAILLGEATHTSSLAPGQSDSTPQSGMFTLPGVVPGNYYVIVRVNSRNEVFEGSNVANNAVASGATIAMDLPALTLGTPTTGNLAAAGAAQYYKLTTTAGGDLNFALSGADGTTNELYVSFGDVPSRQSFLARGVRNGSANESVSLANVQAGTYYVLVYGASLSAAESFTLTANTLGFSLAGVSPVQGSNTGQATIGINGAQFNANSQPQLVDSAGGTIKPTNVYFTDSGLISATFDLTGHPTGLADVQVVNSGGATQTLPHAFNIIAGQPGRLVTSLSAPSAVRLGREFQVSINYTNAGDSDLLAPVLHLGVTSPGELSFTSDVSGAATGLDLIAVNPNGPAGILPPGASGQITVYAASTGAGTPKFQLTQASYPATPIDWADAGPLINPGNLASAVWNSLLPQLETVIGNTWDAYQKEISADATLMSASRGFNYSLHDVLNVAFDKALAGFNTYVSGTLFQTDAAHPLSGATIWLNSSTQAFRAFSSTDGSFLFPSLPSGSYTVTVDGFVLNGAASLTVGSASQSNVSLVVAPAGTITGSVSISPTGAPLANAMVTAVSTSGDAFNTQSDKNGHYSFSSLTAGAYEVSTPAGKYSAASVPNITVALGSVTPNIDLVVQPIGTIDGTISGPSGPVGGATVVAIGADGNGATAITSSTGQYTITGLTGQSYTVRASAAGLATANATGVNLRSGGDVPGVNLTLAAGGSISGSVVNVSGGGPVAAVVVAAVNSNSSYSALSGADGTFTITGLPAGSYQLSTNKLAYMTGATTAMVTAGATTNVTLSVATTGIVTGTVTNSTTGTGLQNVTVDATNSAGVVTSTVTDSSGHYQITGLAAGAYNIQLGDTDEPGVTTTPFNISAGATTATANLSIAVAGIVSGTVFAADGVTPVGGASVALVQGGTGILTTNSDTTGHYSFVVLVPDTYQIEAAGDGLAFAPHAGVSISGGAATTGLNFTAGNDVISGIVTDASSGTPIADAEVRIARTDGVTSSLNTVAQLTTASDGSYAFSGALAGSYSVTVEAATYAIASQAVSVTHGVAATANLSLTGGGNLQGTVVDAATGAPLPEAGILLSGQGSSKAYFTVIADRNGNYSIGQLPLGTYSLVVDAAGHETTVVPSVTVSTAGAAIQNATLSAAAITVSGVVRNAAGPVAGALLIVSDANGLPIANATTAADGSYSIASLAPGSYQIQALAAGHLAPAALSLTVANGDQRTNINSVVTAVAVSDPPASVAASADATATTLNDSLFQAPQLAPGHPTSNTFQCDGGTTLTDNAADIADNQFKALSDYYQVLQPLRDHLSDVYEQFYANMSAVTKAINDIQSELNSVGDVASLGADLSKAIGLSEGSSQLKQVTDRLSKLGPYFDSVQAQMGFMQHNLDTLETEDVSAPGTIAIDFVAASSMQKTAALLDTGINALAFASLYVESRPELAPYKAFISNTLHKVQSLLFNAIGPADALASNATTLYIAARAALHLKSLQQDYNDYVEGLDKAREDQSVEQCPCTKPTNTATSPMTGAAIRAATTEDPEPGCLNDSPNQLGASEPPTVMAPPPDAAPEDQEGPTTSVTVAAPHDPNDLIGPAGYGSQGFIQPGLMPYRADFENDPAKATAAAQVVTATLTLDSHLDPNTFQFTGFGFASHDYTVPAGLSHYQTTIDLRPEGVNLLVPVTLDFNQATGVVNMSFQSLDPLTLQPPDGVNAGFLPIDDANHDGEGYFTFTVRPNAGLAAGTQISEQASIVFDTNSPLATNTATNTIDIGTPTSSVAALPAKSSASFTVNWSGSDDANGSGIAFDDVYVSDNGGPFTPFEVATSQTSATFTGQVGHSYGFYSVATDNVGHRQATPSAAQATTAVVASVTPFNVTEHSYVIGSGTVTVSAANGLLTGDTGPSQLMVTAGTVTGADGGTFTINADGSFTYTPGSSFPGYDNAQFTVTDASGDKGTATVNVVSQHAGVVWKFYESVLNREPDSGGLQYWTNYFNNGGSTGDMAFGFFESDELLNKVLGNYYEQFLLRPLDSGGLAFWKGVWHATGGPEQIKAGFADSPEFYKSSGGTPDSWIDALYQRILSRTPDPSGKTFWLNYYQQQTAAGTDAGTVRFNIALGFFDSQESYGQDVAGWFQEYLFRVPTDAEKAQYVNQMEGGASDRTIEQAITNLPEYGANPSTPADGSAAPLANYYQTPSSSAQAQAALAARDKLFGQL